MMNQKKVKKIRRNFPRRLAKSYGAMLGRALDDYHKAQIQITNELLDRLKWQGALNTDDAAEDISRFANAISSLEFARRPPLEQRLMKLGRELMRFKNTDNKSLGINLYLPANKTERTLNVWTQENTRLIKGMLDDEKKEIAGIVSRAVINGEGVKAVSKEIRKTRNITRHRARLIARTEMGNLNFAIDKAQAKEAHIDLYEWNTAGDSGVRSRHRAMDGKICKYSDPTVYKDSIDDTTWKKRSSIGGVEKHPGQDFQCRCNTIAIVEL